LIVLCRHAEEIILESEPDKKEKENYMRKRKLKFIITTQKNKDSKVASGIIYP